jgi:hypothetical protein
MKYLKLFLIGATALFIVMLGLSLTIPSKVIVSRAINLNPGSDSVLNEVADLARWQKWYPGFEQVHLKYIRIENGRILAGKANGISLKVDAFNDSTVTVQMQKSDRPVMASWKLIRYAYSDSLTLHNTMEFNLKWYPWEKLSGLLFEKSYGPIMEKGLLNLKNGR